MAKKKGNQQAQDHNQRLKITVQAFLPEAVELLVPEFADQCDLSKPEWLQ